MFIPATQLGCGQTEIALLKLFIISLPGCNFITFQKDLIGGHITTHIKWCMINDYIFTFAIGSELLAWVWNTA